MTNLTKLLFGFAALALSACVISNEEKAPAKVDYFLHTGTIPDTLMGGRQLEVYDSLKGGWLDFKANAFTKPNDSCSAIMMVGKSDSSLNFTAITEFSPETAGTRLHFSFPKDSTFTHYRVEVDCRD